STKNDDGRIVYLTPEVKAVLLAQVERVEALQRRLGRIVPYLFPHLARGKRIGKRAGTRRRDFRKTWTTAGRQAGVPGRLPRCFRRTAIRNMERRGVPRSAATQLTGPKTATV